MSPAMPITIEQDLATLRAYLSESRHPDEIVQFVANMAHMKHAIHVPKCRGVSKKGKACCKKASEHFDNLYCCTHGSSNQRLLDAKEIKRMGYVLCHHEGTNSDCAIRCPVGQRYCYRHRHKHSVDEELSEEERETDEDKAYARQEALGVQARIPIAPEVVTPTTVFPNACGLCFRPCDKPLCSFCAVERCDVANCLCPTVEGVEFKGWKFCARHSHYTTPTDASFEMIYRLGIRKRYNVEASLRPEMWREVFDVYAEKLQDYENHHRYRNDQILQGYCETNYDVDKILILQMIEMQEELMGIGTAILSRRMYNNVFFYESKEEYILDHRPRRHSSQQ